MNKQTKTVKVDYFHFTGETYLKYLVVQDKYLEFGVRVGESIQVEH